MENTQILQLLFCSLTLCTVNIVDRDSSVGIASRYCLDGPDVQWRTEGGGLGVQTPRKFDKVPKIKKILLYEIKFLVPNYTCLQNP
jgi:hypothetical protein